jgi:hypothetical protein
VKQLLLSLALVLLPVSALAAGGVVGRKSCVSSKAVLSAVTMESTRTFSESVDAGWSKLHLYFDLTDANTSITRFDLACTVSNDSNATDFTTVVCDDVSDGVCTITRVTGWQLASPGTSKWKVTVRLDDSHAYECSVSVGAGTGAAADVITVERELCAE